jgi:hypothetical protein
MNFAAAPFPLRLNGQLIRSFTSTGFRAPKRLPAMTLALFSNSWCSSFLLIMT